MAGPVGGRQFVSLLFCFILGVSQKFEKPLTLLSHSTSNLSRLAPDLSFGDDDLCGLCTLLGVFAPGTYAPVLLVAQKAKRL